jgi:hypothetical protein
VSFAVRYRPDTPYGRLYGSWQFPWSRGLPTREAAEQLRQDSASTDQMEVIELEESN